MSKLSRYKKPPVIKLPKNQTKLNQLDNDFKVININKDLKEISNNANTKAKDHHAKFKQTRLENCKKSDSGDDHQIKADSTPQNDAEELEGQLICNLDRRDAPENLLVDHKILCPFCWKPLKDKLQSSTHIKACAKHLPVDQVLQAVELHERQMEEWKILGIQRPVVTLGAGAATQRKKPKNVQPGKSGGRRRQGAAGTMDDQLELAIALSESLHEEVQRRTAKEDEFIIANGLQNEIRLSEDAGKPKERPAVLLPPAKNSAPIGNAKGRKAGRTKLLETLPLFTASEADRRTSVETRLTSILDTNGQCTKDYNVRNAVPVGDLQLPKTILKDVNEDGKLWNMASKEGSSANRETYLIEDLKNLHQSKCSTDDISIHKNTFNKLKPSSIADQKVKTKATSHNIDGNKGEKTKYLKKTNTSSKLVCTEPGEMSEEESTQNKSEICNKGNLDNCSAVGLNRSSEVVRDILLMYANKVDTDLIVYGRDERPIKCHKFIVKARCNRLMNDLVIEKSSKGKLREVISLTCYSHNAVKSLVKFLYCGQVSSQISDAELEEFYELAKKYDLNASRPNTKPSNPQGSVDDGKGRKHSPTEEAGEGLFLPTQSRVNVEEASESSNNKNINAPKRVTTTTTTDSNKVQSETRDSGTPKKSQSRNLKLNLTPVPDFHTDMESFPMPEVPSPDMFGDEFEFENAADTEGKNNNSGGIFAYHNFADESPAKNDNVEGTKLEQGFLDDEFLSQYSTEEYGTMNPQPYNLKRTRSLSPLLEDDDDDLLICSQFRNSSLQANKKPKFDKETKSVLNSNNNSVVVVDDDTSDNNKSDHSSEPGPSMLHKSHVDNFSNSLQTEYRENGDLGFPEDDSCLMNIPSVLLDNEQNFGSNKKLESNKTTGKETRSEEPENKEYNQVNNCNNRNKKTTTSKVKRKTGESDKEKYATSVRKFNETPEASSPAITQPSYRMNYSLVDTPILKKELKRFGIKPLPRSKAKLLLRHIDTEMSKKN